MHNDLSSLLVKVIVNTKNYFANIFNPLLGKSPIYKETRVLLCC